MMIINNQIQSVKLSNELSNFFLIPDMIKFIKNISEKINLEKYEDLIISVKYGKRIVINNTNSKLKNISPDDFIEIVDYNPLKKIFLTIGPNKPDFNMSIHWIIQNARRDKNVLIQLVKTSYSDIESNIQKQIKNNSIEISKDILLKFRESNIVHKNDLDIFILGDNLKEMNLIISKIIED